MLAIGDEDGYITVLDPKSPLPRSTKMLSGDPRAQSFRWVAHNNAIFDLKWSRDNHRILTASGDQTIMLWSTARAEPLGCFCSHRGSVKSVALQPMHDEVFASGSRDGRLAVWDTRVLASQIPGQDIPLYQPIVSVQVTPQPVLACGNGTRHTALGIQRGRSLCSLKDRKQHYPLFCKELHLNAEIPE